MTSNMAKSQKINFEDRISNLPRGVIQCVMEFLSVRDAARTCVLSSKWRYVWADHPSLVLDMGFREDIKRHKSPEKFDNIHYANIVGSILLQHASHIRKFVIDVSGVSSNVDLWLSSLCRRRLKELDLKNSDYRNRYIVPSWVFLSSELTHLSLSFSFIRKTVGCFTNIQSLILKYVNFDSIILTTPLLTSLTMERCSFNFEFDISAPRLASLTLDHNNIINLKPFFMCTDIDYAFLFSSGYDVESDGKHLVELLALWPRISLLVVDGFCFKHLITGSIPDNDHILPRNLRCFVLRDVNLDSELIAWILYLLKNSPCLQTFKIWFDDEEVMNDIDEASISMTDFRMDQLRTVMMKNFSASRNEVMFVKILLKCAPLLEKMLVEEDDELNADERRMILTEMFSLQRKYPKTEIIFAPDLLPYSCYR